MLLDITAFENWNLKEMDMEKRHQLGEKVSVQNIVKDSSDYFYFSKSL